MFVCVCVGGWVSGGRDVRVCGREWTSVGVFVCVCVCVWCVCV